MECSRVPRPICDGRVTLPAVTRRYLAASTLGSLGSPSTRSPTMLRWIWDVPPQMVSDREKKNDDCSTDAG